ncbi:hypothetical protein ACFQ1S_15665 [Kibdelosporangium lantanae]|uniref:DUF4235 domain-containing protein n=1 Tax=Kibdelosporangium lantanae TaxID=1497396 RepID=A0ABW3MB17_9PSEU
MKPVITRSTGYLLLAVLATSSLLAQLQRRWRAATRNDNGMETVQVAIALALGVALALLVWAAVKTSTTKYLDQVP